MAQLPKFKQEALWLQALTHRSYLNEHPQITEDNERLEFLGDAILAFLVGELIYRRYPGLSEAELTRLRSNLVEEPQLARIGAEMGLGELLRLGRGAIKDGGRSNPALLCDGFEAVIGAYYLDSGLEAVQEFVIPLFEAIADTFVVPFTSQATSHLIDAKNRFQQWALANFSENPEYEIIDESGPPHAKEFTAIVRVRGIIYGTGKGRRKQEATKAAAEDALKDIEN
jgi:ribonuclease-3